MRYRKNGGACDACIRERMGAVMRKKNAKKVSLFLIVLGLLTCCAGCGGSKVEILPLENFVQESEEKITFTCDGVERYCLLEFPEQTEGAPLVLMLHGHGESPERMREVSQFEVKANEQGYGVVYVCGSINEGDPVMSLGWNSGIFPEGNRDVELLVSLAQYLQETYSFDVTRTYAVGFSNGAFMTHRLAMDASDTFSAVVSVAGKMPNVVWETRGEKNDVSVLQITGEKDDVVAKHRDGSAKYSIDPAIEDVMEYWATSNGLKLTETVEKGERGELTKYDGKDKKVWHLLIRDARHSWYTQQINKVDTNEVILEFFEGLK